MYRIKSFMLMNVENTQGKKIGYINDLLINFYERKVTGFEVTPYSMLKKCAYVQLEDVISYNKKMIVNRLSTRRSIPFSYIRNMDVIDKHGSIIGMVEDIMFDSSNFEIQGMIVSTGLVQNLTKGKKIILQKECIIGCENVFYFGDNNKLNFISKLHRLTLEVKKDEKNEKDI
ncbi:MAG: PRC-barrel domain-containing protein [Bacillota bacterium]|nr:PRC-barrel domain-containing protein [Bacillota bacterium]